MANDYPIRFPAQLRQHLRALRKRRGLTQAQVGALIGVSQARIAEIEAEPGLVSFERLMQLLSALGVTVSLSEAPTVLDGAEQIRKDIKAIEEADQIRKAVEALGGAEQIRKAVKAIGEADQIRKAVEALGGAGQIRKALEQQKEIDLLRNFFAHSKKGSW